MFFFFWLDYKIKNIIFYPKYNCVELNFLKNLINIKNPTVKNTIILVPILLLILTTMRGQNIF